MEGRKGGHLPQMSHPGSAIVNLRCASTQVPFSAILNLLLTCETFGKFVLLKLMVKSQASKYGTS